MKKALFFVSILVVFVLFSAASTVNAAKPADYGLKEGDLISAIFSDDPDVYIINENGYKRLFLNPEIFKFYGHLGGFVNVKLVTPEVRDAFITSGLFRNCEDNDQRVYGVDIEGEDSGNLHWVNVPGDAAVSEDPDFFKKIFCINRKEFKWYPMGTEFKAVREVPKYERIEPQGSAREITIEQGNIKEIGKVVICHHSAEAPNKLLEITIDASALKAHLEHGDSIGVCPSTPQPSQPVTVLSPNGGEVWQNGTTQMIRWQDNRPVPTCASPVSAPTPSCVSEPRSYDIWLVSPGCSQGTACMTAPQSIAKSVSNNSYAWQTNVIGTYNIEVCQAGSFSVCDTSDAPFSIVATITVPTLKVSLDPSTPVAAILNPGQSEVKFASIKVTSLKDAVNNMNAVQIGSDSANAVNFLTNFKIYDGTTLLSSSTFDLEYNGSYYYKWMKVSGFSVPAYSSKVLSVVANVKPQAPSGTVRLGIAGWNFDSPGAQVEPFGTPIYGNPMTISSSVTPSITVLSPNGGEKFQQGAAYQIRWQSTGITSGNVKITTCMTVASYSAVSRSETRCSLPLTVPNSGLYQSTFGQAASIGDYTVRVEDVTNPAVFDESDAPFSIVSAGMFSIADVSGIKSSYAPGEKITLSVKGIEPDGSPATPGEGFSVQVYIFDSPRSKTYAGVNGSYNSSTGLWDALLTAPSDALLTYDLEVFLYCANDSAVCATKYGRAAQVTKLYKFSLSSAQPSITVLSPNGGETWQVGSTQTISWRTTNISSPNDQMTIYIVPVGDLSKNINLAQQIPNTGSYAYIVKDPSEFSYRSPLYQAGNQFEIFVCAQLVGNNNLCSNGIDYSDAPFSIVASVTPTTQSNFSRNLTIGSTGDDVKQLQALLVNEVNHPANLITGYFGRITRDAVKRLQAKYGVRPVSGYFGEITRKALSALISNW